jgi:hypothetical protein
MLAMVSRDIVESPDVGQGCSPPVLPAFRPWPVAEPGSARVCPARGAIRPKACVRFSEASSRSTDRICSAERGILSASARARAAGRKQAEAESAATAFLISPQVDDGLRRPSPCSASASAAPLHQFASSGADSLAWRVFVACSADIAPSKDIPVNRLSLFALHQLPLELIELPRVYRASEAAPHGSRRQGPKCSSQDKLRVFSLLQANCKKSAKCRSRCRSVPHPFCPPRSDIFGHARWVRKCQSRPCDPKA